MGNWKLESHGQVALATFTRPPRNLMDTASMTELEQLLNEVAQSEAVVLVITGGVEGYFIAHADLEDLQKFARREQV
ncbi:MAG: enoyl-CoA hydratase-related protein, partial [Acidimicrobiia bacterium]